VIGILDQFLVEFSLGNEKDFILNDDLVLFKIIEEAGNVLPSFELIFRTQNEKVLGLLNEGNDLGVSYGRSIDSIIDTSLMVLNKTYSRQGKDFRIIRATGLYSASNYVNGTRMRVTSPLSTVEVIREVVSAYFKPEFNIELSNDVQTWVQPNQSDKSFVNELWLRSYVKESFLTTGITSDGRFILKDLKTDLEKEYDWRLTSSLNDRRDILYNGDFAIEDSSGFYNNWMGYGRERMVYNLEDGTNELTTEEMLPILSLTKKLARKAGIEERFAASGIRNENVHEYYWASYLNNLMKLVMMSSVKVKISFSNMFVPIKVLDKVMLSDDDVGSSYNSASEYHAGLYYVTKVVRTLQNNSFITICELCRESLGSIKGDLK